VPLVAVAVLAWLCPSPLTRWRERKPTVAAHTAAPDDSQKPELGVDKQPTPAPASGPWAHPAEMDAAQQASQYPVYQQQQQQQPAYQGVAYGHSPPTAELHGYQPSELPGNAPHGERAG